MDVMEIVYNIIIIVFVLMLIAMEILFSAIGKKHRYELAEDQEKGHIVIRFPKTYLWIGYIAILFVALCFFLMTYFPNGTEAVWVKVLFGILGIAGIYIVLMTKICRIDVFRNENYFLYRSLFCKKRIQYSDCVSYKLTSNSLVLRINKRNIRIDTNMINYEYLFALIKQHKVKEIQ